MKILNSNSPDHLKNAIHSQMNKQTLTPILWKGIVIDVDSDGKKFETKIKGALRVRIDGLDNTITKEGESLLPICLPLLNKSGVTLSMPQKNDWVWIMFEFLEPVGQRYWISTVIDTVPLKENNKRSSYFKLFFGD